MPEPKKLPPAAKGCAGCLGLIVAGVTILAIAFGPSGDSPEIGLVLLSDESFEMPGKVQVERNYLLPAGWTEAQIAERLMALHDAAMAGRLAPMRPKPNCVVIGFYANHSDHAQRNRARWSAYLVRGPRDAAPTIHTKPLVPLSIP